MAISSRLIAPIDAMRGQSACSLTSKTTSSTNVILYGEEIGKLVGELGMAFDQAMDPVITDSAAS